MSERSMLNRYLDSRDGREPAREQAPEDCGAFGMLRGIQSRATMLELRRKDGTIRAIGYSWLERVEYDPDEGITLYAAGQTIRIRGQNLNADGKSLFQGVARHKIVWVQEADRSQKLTDAVDITIIERFEW